MDNLLNLLFCPPDNKKYQPKNPRMMNTRKTKRLQLATLGVVLGTVLTAGMPVHAQTNDMTKLAQENQDLKKRLDAMEDAMKREGITPSGATTAEPIKAMEAMTISGYVSASYFYDAANNHDIHPNGYLWNNTLNSFDLNEIKLTIASPAVDKSKWDAAYRVSLIYGQDAPYVDSGSGGSGGPSKGVTGFTSIREGYVELNIPIGTGLDVKAGELISLLNYESGDGGAANDNFSQGYQWWYTGNGPSAGVQLSYDFNDKFGIKLRVQNGLFTGPVDPGSKTFLGSVSYKPDAKTTLTLLGFSGEQNIPIAWRDDGAEFIGTRNLTDWDHLNFATEIDYWRYEFSGTPEKNGDFYSFGGWLTGDVARNTTWALRGDFIYDPTGFATFYQSPDPATYNGGSSFNGLGQHGQDLSSVTLTLNWKPAANIKIQPEARWNHSTLDTALNGKSDQFIVGCGVSYAF
jgi:Putative beta-barrel porin-2, OmpL-like. bbp2